MSKAFDKLNCYILLKKLMEKKCPVKLINILHMWFNISCTIIKWGERYSSLVFPTTGVRQGSMLSPLLFSVYVDDMLNCLNRSKFGCQVKDFYFNAFMYADDLLLVSISVSDLQKLLEICETELIKIYMRVKLTPLNHLA